MRTLLFIFTTTFFLNSYAQNSEELDAIINNWHLAATNANFEEYFACTDSSFIFLGTDPNERWTKNQFMEFSKPYFKAGKAWDFKSSDRIWMFSSDGNTAWFDEKLDTWMEDCRGAGVMIKVKGVWKLAYYNLTVLIENEKVKEFIELRKK